MTAPRTESPKAQEPFRSASAAAPEDTQSLQQLEFVKSTVSSGIDFAGAAYAKGKTMVPGFAKGYLQSTEDVVVKYSSPYVPTVQSYSEKALGFADAQVNRLVSPMMAVSKSASGKGSDLVRSSKDFYNSNLETFCAAREAYLQKISDALDVLKKQGLTGAAETGRQHLTSALSRARFEGPEYVRTKSVETVHAVVDRVMAAYNGILEVPAVSKTLDSVKPYVDAATSKYMAAHDALVSHPQYKRAWDNGNAALGAVSESAVYKSSANKLYPLVAPIADPTLDYLQKSEVVDQAVAHVRPAKTA